MPASVRSVRTAAILRLRSVVTLVNNRVFTPPVPQGTAFPYLVLSDYSERDAVRHYAGSGVNDDSFQIRGVVKLVSGDAPMLAIWEQVYAALHEYPLTVAGHQVTIGEVRYITDYAEPSDATLRNFVARYETMAIAT